MSRDRVVRILNPVEGASRFTNRRRAERYVSAAKAEWTDASCQWIRFIDRDANRQVINQHRLTTSLGLDGIGRRMTRAEMAAIPVLQATKLTVDTSKTPRRIPRFRNGPVLRPLEIA